MQEVLPARAKAKLDLLTETLTDATAAVGAARQPIHAIANRRQPLAMIIDCKRRELRLRCAWRK